MDRSFERTPSINKSKLILIALSLIYIISAYLFDSFIIDNLHKYFGNTGLITYFKLSALLLSVIISIFFSAKLLKVEVFILVSYFIYISLVFIGNDFFYEALHFWANAIGYFSIYFSIRTFINKYNYESFIYVVILLSFISFSLSFYVDFGNYERAAFRDDSLSTYVCSQVSIRKCGISNNPNTLAILLFPLILEMVYAMYKKIHSKLLLPIFICTLLTVFMTGSKTIILLCLFTISLFLLTQNIGRIIKMIVLILLLLVFISMFFSVEVFNNIINARFATDNVFDSSGRLEIYAGVLDKLNQNPLFGTGINLHEDYSSYFPRWFRLSDSAYGNILVSTGFIGFMVFTITMFCLMHKIYNYDKFRLCLLLVILIAFFFEDLFLRSYVVLFFISVTFSLITKSKRSNSNIS